MSLILIVMIFLFICSCTTKGKTKTSDKDYKIAHETIEVVLETIQTKNIDALKKLFSKTALAKTNSFDDSVEMLFKYFDGTVESYDDGSGPFVETTRDNDKIYQLIESSFEVKTGTNEYRFAMQYVTLGDEEDIGITSLYVIKLNDDKDLTCAYWGDGLFTPGIHVAIPNGV